MIRFQLSVRSCLAAVVIALLAAASPAAGRPMTDAEVDELLPDKDRDDKPVQRYRWRDGLPITVVVITDGQRDPCVGAAIRQIQAEVDSLRREIPGLGLQPAVVVSDWVPQTYQPAMLIIALPTENERIVRALARLAAAGEPRAKVVEKDRSFGSSHGSGRRDDPPDIAGVSSFAAGSVRMIADGQVAIGYDWAVNQRGMERSTGSCIWSWGTYLLWLLGANDMSPYSFWRRLEGMSDADRARTELALQRLFLQALYQSREAAVDMATVRRTFRRLVDASPEMQRLP
jgi:hypothetical protein